MRRRTSLSVWLILGLVASLGIAPSMSAKQGQEPHEDLESSFSIDIEMTCGGAPCDVTEQFQAYDITFLPAAYIPERTYTGAMIVKVQEGTFAFRVQSNDVLVDPQGSEIQLLEANPPVPLGTPPKDVMPAFNPNGTIPISDCLGTPPHQQTLCRLNPELFLDGSVFVQLEPGDTVYLPDQSTCFFCNTAGADNAQLLVWAPGTDFEWQQLYAQQASIEPDAKYVQGQGLHDVRGWMRNPGSPCH